MQWEGWGGILTTVAGIVGGAGGMYLGLKKQRHEERKQLHEEENDAFHELEAIKNHYRDMFEEVKKQVETLIPQVRQLQLQQIENTAEIQTLKRSEELCQSNLTRLENNNRELMKFLREIHNDKTGGGDGPVG